MKLEELGYNKDLQKHVEDVDLSDFRLGRVIAEHKERYVVQSEAGELEAEITGNMRFTAASREDFPAVGDWVAMSVFEHNNAIIHKILPRTSMLKRQAVGQAGEIQLIAANIDYAFIVLAVDRDFNINRIERYLTICHASEITPLIILTKTDLVDEHDLTEKIKAIKDRAKDVPVLAISNISQSGYKDVHEILIKGKTYCMLGSSGVGKSSLLNNLSGRKLMKTDAISQSSHKGRHTTSHRELVLLEQGALLIDNPGMREVGMTDATGGLESTFEQISQLAESCKFKDCSHTGETGCSVIDALEQGHLDRHAYENYLKLEREKDHFESTLAERRKKDKDFGKMVKNVKSDMKKYKSNR